RFQDQGSRLWRKADEPLSENSATGPGPPSPARTPGPPTDLHSAHGTARKGPAPFVVDVGRISGVKEDSESRICNEPDGRLQDQTVSHRPDSYADSRRVRRERVYHGQLLYQGRLSNRQPDDLQEPVRAFRQHDHRKGNGELQRTKDRLLSEAHFP